MTNQQIIRNGMGIALIPLLLVEGVRSWRKPRHAEHVRSDAVMRNLPMSKRISWRRPLWSIAVLAIGTAPTLTLAASDWRSDARQREVAPTLTLTGSPTSITAGGNSTLNWTSRNATSCTASGSWSGTKSTTGSSTISPTTTRSYALSCRGTGGSISRSVTVTVTAAAPTPTLTLVASPISVVVGGRSTLSWNSQNATTCTASGAWSGSKNSKGRSLSRHRRQVPIRWNAAAQADRSRVRPRSTSRRDGHQR